MFNHHGIDQSKIARFFTSHEIVTLSQQSFERLQRLLELLYQALDHYTDNFAPIYPDPVSEYTDEQSIL